MRVKFSFWIILISVFLKYIYIYNILFNISFLDRKLSLHSIEKQVTGEVIGLPDNQKLVTHFLFNTKLGILRLSWYKPEFIIKTGDQWQFWLKLKKFPYKKLNKLNKLNKLR